MTPKTSQHDQTTSQPLDGRRAQTMVRSRGLGLALIGALAVTFFAGASPATAQASGWKHDWKVQCTWEKSLRQRAMWWAARQFLKLKLDDDVIDALISCDDSKLSPAQSAREQLRASGFWYESLGFAPPDVEVYKRDRRKYRAWFDIHSFLSEDKSTSEWFVSVNGAYYHLDPGRIWLSPASLTEYGVESHELFHGVQKGTVGDRMSSKVKKEQWVWEGTARAAQNVWALKSDRATTYEIRNFDEPLDDYSQRYGAAPFWRDVGRQLRSADRIEYLRPFFERMGRSSEPSMLLLDQELRAQFAARGVDDAGLGHAYAEFVRFALRRDDYHMFKDVKEVSISLPDPQAEHFAFVGDQRTVGPASAEAILLRVSVPPSRNASLRVELATKSPDLHLIVDDRRYNREPAADDENGKRNRFATIVPGNVQEQLFWVRVANMTDPANPKPVKYPLHVELASPHGSGRSRGVENVSFDDGVLFTYINTKRDPEELAANTVGDLIARNADADGKPREARPSTTPGVPVDLDEVFGPGTIPPRDGEGRSSVTPGAECAATMTLFEDSNRTLAKLIWRGRGPFFGGTHRVEARFATNVHDSVYNEFKNLGQLDFTEDPESRAKYIQGFRELTIPGMLDLYRQAGMSSAVGSLGDVLEEATGLTGLLGFVRDPLERRAGGDQNLITWFEGEGTIEVSPSAGDRVDATFRFDAKNRNGRSVLVSGNFLAVPGPLSSDHIWNGCERLFVAEEDNEDPPVSPATYPPGVGGKSGGGVVPVPPPLPCLPKATGSITEILTDWSDVRTEDDGTVVQQRSIRKTPYIALPGLPLGFCKPTEEVETRRLEPDPKTPRDCKPGPMKQWTVDAGDWQQVTVQGESLWERTLRYTPTVDQPALNGGDDAACRPFEAVQRSPEPTSPDEEEDVRDCVPGPKREWSFEVLEDWHPVVMDGIEVDRRIVRRTPTILRAAAPGGSSERCQAETVIETRPKRFRLPPGGSLIDPTPDPSSGPGADRSGAPSGPRSGGGAGTKLEGALLLDFLETGDADLRSAPQQVRGSATPVAVELEGSFDIAFGFDRGDLSVCNDPIVRSALSVGNLVPEKASLRLDAAAGQLELTLAARGGEIVLRGSVQLSAASPNSVMGVLSGGDIELRSGRNRYGCEGLLDFSFLVSEVP